MPDTKEVILTEYKTKGLDNAVADQKKLAAQYEKTAKAQDKVNASGSKLEQRLGKLQSFGRNLRQAGGFLGSDTIAALGDVADGFSDIGDSINTAVKEGGKLGKIGAGIGAVLGGITAGASIYDATIGKLQGGNTAGNILGQFGQFAAAGFNQDQLRKNMAAELGAIRFQVESAQITANNAVFDFKAGLGKNNPTVNDIAGRTFNAIGGLFNGTGLGLGNRANQFGQAAQDVFQRQQNAQQWQQTFNRLSNLRQQSQNLMQAGNTLRIGTTGAENAYKAALYNIERETGQKRAEIARQYAMSLVDFDKQYYEQRAKVAQDYGVEEQRMEAEHAKQMRRLSEDHQSRLKKLAESRDALAIEDEIESYNKERSRAEEDYQQQAKQRHEDFAMQMAEMEQAHQEQRNERQRAYQEQLRDLQMQANERRKVEYANYQLLLGDLVKAFQDARAQYAASVTNNNTSNTTNNNNANINVSPRYGGERDIAEAVYGAVVQAFGG